MVYNVHMQHSCNLKSSQNQAGDWVCSSCALKHGIKTGIGGYELELGGRGSNSKSKHNPNLEKDSTNDNPSSASIDMDKNSNDNEDENEKRDKDKEGQSSESSELGSDEEESIAYKDFIRQRQKRMRTSNPRPRLFFESDSE